LPIPSQYCCRWVSQPERVSPVTSQNPGGGLERCRVATKDRVCRKCKRLQPLAGYRQGRHKCRDCERTKSRDYYRLNPSKRQQHQARWREKQRGRDRYKISTDEFDFLLRAQRGRCAICGAAKNVEGKTLLCVDHCHETGSIRGLLCNRCNSGIGMLKDDPRLVARALRYLKKVPALDRSHSSAGEGLGGGPTDRDLFSFEAGSR
jgi:hypothetical protein